MADKSEKGYRVSGRVIDGETRRGLIGLRVEAWDRDLVFNDLLGSAITDEQGAFQMQFDETYFRELFLDRQADLFFRIFRENVLIKSTESSVMWNVESAETPVVIEVDTAAAEENPRSFVVLGRVRYPDGKPYARCRVKAFDKRLRTEVLLGETVTDTRGVYEIRYAGEAAEAHPALSGLVVRGYDGENIELAASPILFHPEPEQTLNLVVGNAAYLGPSEYERLVGNLTPLLEGLSFADLVEDEEHGDVAWLSGRSGQDPLRIGTLVAAHRLARRAELPPEIFYGLLRHDLPPNLSALLIQDPDLVRRSLELAIEKNLIPACFAEGIDDLLERFKRLSVTEALRPVEEGEARPPLITLLGTVIPDRDRQATFLEHYLDYSGPMNAFWEELRAVPELADRIDALQFALQVGALTGNHMPLVRRLQQIREQGDEVDGSGHRIRTFRDLVYVAEDEWARLIAQDTADGRIGVPGGMPGQTDTDRIKGYARTLARVVERTFPTAYAAARLVEDDLEGKEQLLAFLRRNVATFEIDGARLETYLADHPEALADIPESDRPELRQRLRAMQRVYRVAPRYEAMSALLKDGIDSAQAIVEMGRELFALRYGHNPALDNQATAYKVYARAEQTHAMALAIATDHGMSGMRVPMDAVTDERATLDSAIPDWQTLFGSLELCDCEHCRSVYSPAAYLVDLLHFLQGRKIIDPDSIERENGYVKKVAFLPGNTPDKDLTAKDILFSRRADLGKIDLSCANTSTPLPYVDLVNEALEDFVAQSPDFSPFQLAAALATDLDARQVSADLDTAFANADCSLSEHATIEVIGKGKHWRLHDRAYSYDIRIESGAPRVRARGRQTAGTKQELAANPQYLNPAAYEKLGGRVFPLTLPFDLYEEEARTYLCHLGVKRYRLMEAFLPGTRQKRLDNAAIALAHLGITTTEAKLITGDIKSQTGPGTPLGWDPGVWNLWGFAKAKLDAASAIPDPADSATWFHKIEVPTPANPQSSSSAWLDLLTGRVDVFLQQSGLAFKEMRDLLGTYFVNPLLVGGGRLISLAARPGEPEDTCETKRLRLIGMDEDAALRAVRFVRLWRKLDWSMRDLDRALTALGVNVANDLPQAKIQFGATGEAPIDATILTKLSHVRRLQEQLGVSAERLLAFWGPIDGALYTDHNSPDQQRFPSLYEQLFRNKQVINPPDAAFPQDPADLSEKVSAHRPTIAAALGLGAADLDLLIRFSLPQAHVTLSLATLSALYRHATLADALGLSVREYLTAIKLSFDPFASTTKTVLFVEQMQAMASCKLTLVELDYLSRHSILESDRAAPTDAEIGRDLAALRDSLGRIADENRLEGISAAAGGPTGNPGAELARNKLALLGWEQALIDDLIGALNDSAVYRAKLVPPAAIEAKDYATAIAKLNQNPGSYSVPLANLPANVQIPLDAHQQPLVVHANGELKASRRLIPSERTALRTAVKDDSDARAAVEALIDQQDGFLTTISYDASRKKLLFAGVMRNARKELLLGALSPADAAFKAAVTELHQAPRALKTDLLTALDLEALFDQPKTPPERFEYLLKKLLPHLVELLGKRALAKFFAETFGLETQTSNELLNERLPWPKHPGKPLAAAFLDPSFAQSDPSAPIAETQFKEQFAAYRLLHKVALIILRLECTARQARWLFDYAHAAGWPDLRTLPILFDETAAPAATLDSWLRLVRLVRVRDAMPRGEEMLEELLARATAVGGTADEAKAAYISAIRDWTEWPEGDLATLLGSPADHTEKGQLGIAFPSGYAGAALPARLLDCFGLLERTGLSAANCGKVVADDGQQPAKDATAQAVKEAARGKYDESQWLKVAPPLRNALRERQRAALLAYLMSSPDKKHRWRKANDVYGYFLLDTEMSPCQLTSRIKQAIGSVQLFIQRCLMGLEHYEGHQVLATAEIDNRWREWHWMKNYRVWEANRKIFLYPENWIEPELRDDKTPFFRALEGELLQTNLTNETAAAAFRGYLEQLDTVARLEAVALYQEKEVRNGQTVVDHLHVFGRTAGEPHQYFYRRWVDRRYWTPWEGVDLDIGCGERAEPETQASAGAEMIPDHLVPVVWRRRLLLIWPIFSEEASTGTSSGSRPEKRWKVQLAWSEYRDGSWNPKRASSAAYRHAFLKNNIPKERFIFKAVQVESELESSPALTIKCYVLTRQCRSANDGESFAWDYEHLITFALDSCTGDFAITATDKKGYLNRPSQMGPRSMTLCPCETPKAELYLPSTTSDLTYASALQKTRPEGFRILYAHQRQGFNALWSDPWFFNDNVRTYFVLPGPLPVFADLELANPASNESLAAAQGSWLSSLTAYTRKDPFSAVQFAQPRQAMVNPGDPLVNDDDCLIPMPVEPVSAKNEGPPPATEVAVYLGGVEKAFPLVNMVMSVPEYAYRFHLFYHPYICAFFEALNRNGVDALLQRPLQLLSEKPLEPEKSVGQDTLFEAVYAPKAGVGALVDVPYPTEDVDFSPGGAYSQYNWELFFHAPLLIADSLRKNQRFEDAQRWFHYIFDPTDASGLPVPERYWRTKPFYLRTNTSYQLQHLSLLLRLLACGGDIGKLTGVSDVTKQELKKSYEELIDSVANWRKDPFKPHLVARTRTTAYQKAVVRKYLDTLIEWGDQLFRRDTMESINEATQLYILAADILGRRPDEIPERRHAVHTYESLEPLLGEFSNALVQIEELVPPSALGSDATQAKQPIPPLPATLYFCIPKNDELLGYWDKVADRLFKIRHCMNIEGETRQLPLFAPPINPALLVKAAAAGLDIGSVLADVSAPLPHYRFQVLAQKATELCVELKSLGAALLSTLEKRDAEQLALLRASQEKALLKLIEQVRTDQATEADRQIEVLLASREIASTRLHHVHELLTGSTLELPSAPRDSAETVQPVQNLPQPSENASTLDEGGVRMISQEAFELDEMKDAKEYQAHANRSEVAANLFHFLLPNISFPAGLVSVSFGGSNLGAAASAFAAGFRSASNSATAEASRASRVASLIMRGQDWQQQTESIAKEVTHIDQQISVAQIRKDIAAQELKNHKDQIVHAEKVEKTLQDKYTNKELYSWMVGQVSGVYFQSYELAYDLAKRAERALRHELGLTDSSYIQFGYWDSLKKGLLAGERLTQDLKRMEVAYLERNCRELEITKHVSLVQLNPIALIELRETGKCSFEVPEALFDLDYPGHFMRRLKTVSLTIPCVTGPYTGVSCTLTLVRSSVRHSNLLSNGAYARKPQGDDPRFTDDIGLAKSIVTSSGRDDSGLFETNLRDERFLPFEGAGAISTWQLELPTAFAPFDYDTITDIVLHMRYTARSAGGLLKEQAVSELKGAVNAIVKAGNEQGLARVFSLRHEFPSQWQSFVTVPEGSPGKQKRECTFDASQQRFPYVFQGQNLKATGVNAYVAWKQVKHDGQGAELPKLALVEEGKSVSEDFCTTGQTGGAGNTLAGNRLELDLPSKLGDWTLAACLDKGTAAKLRDILIICHYAIE